MADLWEKYFSSVWAVVWATYPDEASYLRSLMPNQIFLVPWYWAQWWNLESVRACFNQDKLWAIINSTRWINYNYLNNKKYSDENFIDACRDAIILMKEDLDKI
jgi:orotidine-5'-phosphate decarboxylase